MKIFTSLLRKVLQTSGTKVTIPQKPPKVREGNALFGKYLLATNTISSGFLMIAGDLIVQEFEYQKGTLEKRYNWTRCGKILVNYQQTTYQYYHQYKTNLIKCS